MDRRALLASRECMGTTTKHHAIVPRRGVHRAAAAFCRYLRARLPARPPNLRAHRPAAVRKYRYTTNQMSRPPCPRPTLTQMMTRSVPGGTPRWSCAAMATTPAWRPLHPRPTAPLAGVCGRVVGDGWWGRGGPSQQRPRYYRLLYRSAGGCVRGNQTAATSHGHSFTCKDHAHRIKQHVCTHCCLTSPGCYIATAEAVKLVRHTAATATSHCCWGSWFWCSGRTVARLASCAAQSVHVRGRSWFTRPQPNACAAPARHVLAARPPICRYGKYGIPGGAVCEGAANIAQCPRPWQ